MPKILIVDDEQAICWGLQKLGISMGHQVFVASSAEQGLRLAAESKPDLLILDVRLPGIDGLSAMQQFRREMGGAPIVVITAFGDLATAVKAVQNGAFEYVLKPFDLAEIRETIRRAFYQASAFPSDDSPELAEGLLGRSPVMQEVFKRIALAAHSDRAVLVSGETGTGKEATARAIHRHSDRAAGPFIKMSIVALDLPADQVWVESFAAASGGTLFLDEVTELPLSMQLKLVQAIESTEGQATQDESHNVRFISATRHNLMSLVQSGELRHELFYKLNGFEIHLPALRDRVADIPLLARHFASERQAARLTFSEEALAELSARPWHGNVRELRNAVEHAMVVVREGLVLPNHLPPALPSLESHSPVASCQESLSELARLRASDLLGDPQSEGFVYEKFLEEVEPALLESAMDRYSHECAPAARALGLHRTTLKRKLDQYGMSK